MRLVAAAVLIAAGPVLTFAGSRAAFPPQESRRALELSNEVPDSCPVTKLPEHPFVPPAPYPSVENLWIGSPKLWTDIPRSGMWRGLPHYTPEDSRFRQKLFWWSEGYDWRLENPPGLTVTGERLDAPAAPLATDEHANAGWTNDRDHAFMVAGIFIPTVGCWKITGHYKGETLSYVVWVSERRDASQSSECRSDELLALIKTDDPAYADAMDLARTLQGRGFIVKCVLQSVMVHTFQGQKGAAVFRTDRGDFDVLFLPEPQTFATVEILERRENGRFLYSFRGSPRAASPHPIDSAYPMYFVKHADQLFITWESKLPASIVKAVT